MKTFSLTYSTQQEFTSFITSHDIQSFNNILIQVFSGVLDATTIQDVLVLIHETLPQATVIGTTTTGEILHGKSLNESITIVISIFEETTLRSIMWKGHDAEQIKSEHWMPLLESDTKAVIMFSSGFDLNHTATVQSFPTLHNEIIIAGGIAGDNNRLIETRLFHETHQIEKGIVAVSLSGQELSVQRKLKFNWQPIGNALEITKAAGNTIFEIEGVSVRDIYIKYLGEGVALNLPGTASLFPLVHNRNGVLNSNVMLQITPEGGGLFTGGFAVGEKVQLAYADSQMLLDNEVLIEVEDEQPESIFIYSCGGRKSILGDDIEKEILPLNVQAPTNGFFAYGEFYTAPNGTTNILNNTMTMLLLREGKRNSINQLQEVQRHNGVAANTVEKKDFIFTNSDVNQSLRHFTKVITQELLESKIELEKQNKELFQANKKVEEAIRTKDKFFSIIAHDLRSPFTSILGFTNLLSQGLDSYDKSDIAGFNDIISNAAQNTLELLDNLLNWARAESNNISYQPEKTDMSLLVENLLKLINPIAQEKNISVAYEESEEITVHADTNMISTVLRNLISNAIKFTNTDGIITIQASKHEDFAEITIADNGIGMDEDTKKKLFNLATIQPTLGTANERGTGLGLVLCKDFVTKHGGTIWVESELGKGSTFKFTLPIAPPNDYTTEQLESLKYRSR
jgi:signal transduction histidine kinase